MRTAIFAMLSIVTLMAIASVTMDSLLPLLPVNTGIIALCSGILVLGAISLFLTLKMHRLRNPEVLR